VSLYSPSHDTAKIIEASGSATPSTPRRHASASSRSAATCSASGRAGREAAQPIECSHSPAVTCASAGPACWLAASRQCALIATPTGRAFGQVVLDVDVKHANQDGRRTLHELGTILPATPRAHTPSGGVHIHFDPAGREIVSTVGAQGRGIGAGLDWRAELASIILPTPGTGYRWDPRYNLDTVPLARVPEALLPKPPRQAPDPANAFWQQTIQEGVREQSRYAAGALARAAHRIANAPNGQQEWTLNSESLGIGNLVGSGGIGAEVARTTLLAAALSMRSYREPWQPTELERKIDRALTAGVARPRQRPRQTP
jgi:Bifunctional DNA primase/polymerase, N-terminal